MTDPRFDQIREDLRALKGRTARGEIDEPTYFRLKEELLSELTPQERQAVESPAPRRDPGSGPLRPAGGRGGEAVRTHVPSLAELDLAVGTVLFEQWRIVRELGRGGFGVVFEAEETHLGETQAIKVLDPAMKSRSDLLDRFRREVKVMRRLDPRHVVRVFDYREDPDRHLALISMEYVAGGTVWGLRDLARRKGERVPVTAVVAILAQTLEALAEAHDQGVIHRDVTPGNVLLAGAGPEELLAEPGRDPGVKLVDFGIAGLVDHVELSQKTRSLGTAPYVAPEVLVPEGEVTPAADVYGAGAMAYELLTGKLPLGRFPQPSETRSDVPPALDRLLPELLDQNPARRPPARRARQRALARRAPRIPAAPRISRPPSPAPAAARGRGKRVWLPVAGVVVAVVAALFSYWLSRQPGRNEIAEPVRQPVEAPAEPATADTQPDTAPDSWQDPTTDMRFRYIPAGTFTMGSPESEPGRRDDETRHEVTLTRAFWMAETEVTQAQWRAVMGTNPSRFANCGDECPVERVNWYHAVTFANRLSGLSKLNACYELTECKGTGGGYRCATVKLRGLDCRGYRLPTEAEWEYAARATTTTTLYTGPLTIRGARNGPELDEIAWYGGNSGVGYDGGRDCSDWPEKQYSSDRCGTHPVGRKVANRWGLRDMLGNVWEWTWDPYGDYGNASVTASLGPSRGYHRDRVLRGGSWRNSARYCRVAYRGQSVIGGYDLDYVGFRLVRTYP